MSDKILNNNDKNEYEYKEGEEGLIQRLKNIKTKINGFRDSEGSESKRENSEASSSTLSITNSDDSDDENRGWTEKVGRFTVLVVGVEIFLIVYFIAALLDFVPFF